MYGDECLRVAYSGFDLQSISYNRWVQQQFLDSLFRESCNLLHIEFGKQFSIAIPLVEYRRPAETGLSALENQELELGAIIVYRRAPLRVVILDIVEANALGPFAAFIFFVI